MFRRNLIPVWVGIILLFGMFLMGQEGWGQTTVTELEGTWEGVEVVCGGNDIEGFTFVFTNNIVEMTGPWEWCNATFSLNTEADPKKMDTVITDCFQPEWIGETALFIYLLQGDMLQMASWGPGGVRATDFDPCNARVIRVDLVFPVDTDGDCLPNHLDPCPLDQDCDDDGLIDGNCGSVALSNNGPDSRLKALQECVGNCATEDLNNNGQVDPGETDPELFDTDGDGISDGVERGLVEPPIPEATDPLVFVPDADPSTTTDPTKQDTDRDGIPDGVEDPNHNGRVDEGETDPRVRDNGSQCSVSTSASTHQASTVYGSKVLTRHLAYLLLPVGVAILLTPRRRRK